MKLLEKTLFFVIIISISLHFMLLPGMAIITVLCCLLLSILYFYLSFFLLNNIGFKKIFKKKSYEDLTTLKTASSILLGVGYSIIPMGFLFKLLIWPGSKVILLLGILFSTLVFFGIIISDLIYKKNLTKSVIVRFTILIAFGLSSYIISDVSIIKIKYREYPKYVNAYVNYLENPESDSLLNIKNEEENKMFEEIKTIYKGEFKDGLRNGQGTIILASGAMYVGEFKDGKINGQGTYTYFNGDKYVGEFKNGLRNGKGTYINADGSTYYSGLWKNDEPAKFLNNEQ